MKTLYEWSSLFYRDTDTIKQEFSSLPDAIDKRPLALRLWQALLMYVQYRERKYHLITSYRCQNLLDIRELIVQSADDVALELAVSNYLETMPSIVLLYWFEISSGDSLLFTMLNRVLEMQSMSRQNTLLLASLNEMSARLKHMESQFICVSPERTTARPGKANVVADAGQLIHEITDLRAENAQLKQALARQCRVDMSMVERAARR